MRIIKVLNQNAVIVMDNDQEKIAVGKGIGFNRKKETRLSLKDVERLFSMEPEGQRKLQNLLKKIDEASFLASETIIAYAEKVLGEKLNEHINISLSDHNAFAAENIRDQIVIKNKLLREIEMLYPEEFAISQWAVDYLTQTLDLPFDYDEAGYIAIHITSARKGHISKEKSIREVTFVSEIIKFIEAELKIDLHTVEMNMDYSRLVSHLRLLLERSFHKDYTFIDPEMFETIKNKYKESYKLSKKITVVLSRDYHFSIPDDELGFLTIHIERLRQTKK